VESVRDVIIHRLGSCNVGGIVELGTINPQVLGRAFISFLLNLVFRLKNLCRVDILNHSKTSRTAGLGKQLPNQISDIGDLMSVAID
jgi:hypothetical protein